MECGYIMNLSIGFRDRVVFGLVTIQSSNSVVKLQLIWLPINDLLAVYGNIWWHPAHPSTAWITLISGYQWKYPIKVQTFPIHIHPLVRILCKIVNTKIGSKNNWIWLIAFKNLWSIWLVKLNLFKCTLKNHHVLGQVSGPQGPFQGCGMKIT